ncbi:MAG: hypothetical protein EZS28_029880 [Streblomastix strix]|uniref:Uncharacterized protein n=1 Tax=Streblomastix strix TaxID=222440 RepID=A0A5J4UWI7_9EUKA|nr:MAG: hypothetical protein EZS28_029880 [Streblomastix strix]
MDTDDTSQVGFQSRDSVDRLLFLMQFVQNNPYLDALGSSLKRYELLLYLKRNPEYLNNLIWKAKPNQGRRFDVTLIRRNAFSKSCVEVKSCIDQSALQDLSPFVPRVVVHGILCISELLLTVEELLLKINQAKLHLSGTETFSHLIAFRTEPFFPNKGLNSLATSFTSLRWEASPAITRAT